MAAKISAPASLSAPPAWALARVPGLERGELPLELSRLAGGSVNEVFRIVSRSGRFVLRLDGAAWRRPGVDRERELALHRVAAEAGIAPALVYAEPRSQGLLISAFEPGRLWQESDYADPQALRRLGERLQALHALPAPQVARFDPWQVAQDYVRLINGQRPAAVPAAELKRTLQQLRRSCAALGDDSAGGCIVHGDLAQSNLLEGSRLWLLDWEYAQRSDALMDLACVLAYYPNAQRHGAEFAAAAGLGTAARAEALAPRLYIYRALSWLWYLARGERSAAPQEGA
ncbi:MAG: phosphotransferase [Steroidobacteraceae bacterium]